MKIKILSFALLLMSVGPFIQAGELEDLIAKARAQLGTEYALDSVKTLQYFGTVFDGDGKEIGKMELRFKKPHLQRLDIIEADKKEITGISDYEGYVQFFGEEGQSLNLRVLGAPQVKLMQINAHENLSFFTGPQKRRGGDIELLETVDRDGVKAKKVRFSYDAGSFHYDRFFDASTGKLLATVSGNNGLELRETGELEASGITFPKEVLTYDGDKMLRRVVFNKVLVNEDIADAVFEFPSKY